MIRVIEQRYYAGDSVFAVMAGNSSDSKPTAGIITGSQFIEADTGKTYLYDEDSGAWNATGSGNGKTTIADATVTLGSTLTYDGTEKTQSVSTVKIGATTLTASTDYEVTNNKGTEPGTYTLRIIGKGSYVGHVDKEFTIAKASGSVTADPDSLSLDEGGDAGTSTLSVTGDGAVSVASSATDVATVTIADDTVTVTPVGAGSATVTVTLAESDHYTGGTDTISVTVSAAEEQNDDT